MIQKLIFRQFGIRLSIVSVGMFSGNRDGPAPLYRAYEQDRLK